MVRLALGGFAAGRSRRDLRRTRAGRSRRSFARELFFFSKNDGVERSRTLGPKDDRSVLATDFAAWMLAFCASIPRTRVFAPCSWEIRGEKRTRRVSARDG